MDETICYRCNEQIDEDDDYISTETQTYHDTCFRCDQCFQEFPDNVYFDFEDKIYCEDCFNLLYSPICAGCGVILEDVFKIAMGKKWHTECLICSTCNIQLSNHQTGFKQSPDGRALCQIHYEEELKCGFDKEICQHKNCRKIVEKSEMIRFKGEAFHAYHFKCSDCQCELTSNAKELKSKLYCLSCHDRQECVRICTACHKPIDGRSIIALNSYWHLEHFVCTTCQKPFFGQNHYEYLKQAYCLIHFKEMIGIRCFSCQKIIAGDHIKALDKPWHDDCFRCSQCDGHLNTKEKLVSIDGRPTCLECWKLMPGELKKRLKA